MVWYILHIVQLQPHRQPQFFFSSLNDATITTYMVIDLKVLAKSFNWEDRSCYVGNPCESFVSRSRK